MKIIDLSVPLESSPSEPQNVEVIHDAHDKGVAGMTALFGCETDDLPDSLGWAVDTLTLSTHAGTHVDAPWHYAPVAEGKKSRTIDEMPLEWFYGDGVVIDVRHKSRGSVVGIDDLETALEKIDYELKPGNIVMIQTGTDKLWGEAAYFESGCGMSKASTLWLIDRGIRVMGTDAWGWDRPFWAIKEAFEKTKDRSVLWGAHFAGIEKEYCHIEKLANLDALPEPFGFKVACFPVKITGGSAGWVRVVAILEDA
ncbi:MAG: cyclase family protein [Desulfobacterales bacterium]